MTDHQWYTSTSRSEDRRSRRSPTRAAPSTGTLTTTSARRSCKPVRGISKWQGPREELILITTAFALLLAGATVGTLVGRLFVAPSSSLVGIAIAAGVLTAQTAFILAPLIARRARRVCAATTADSR